MNKKQNLILNIRESINNILNEKNIRENSSSKLYKIVGYLVTSNDKKTQSQILSDIRALTGITTIDAQEYVPRLPNKNYSYDKLTIKIDPYPYLKNGEFNIETIKKIIENINGVKGVIKFKAEPKLINIGI